MGCLLFMGGVTMLWFACLEDPLSLLQATCGSLIPLSFWKSSFCWRKPKRQVKSNKLDHLG